MLRHILALAFLIVVVSPADATAPEIRPGKYVRDFDTGSLTIRRDQGKLTFAIESTGGNCHSCSVSGEIRAGLGYADDGTADEATPKCLIAFSALNSTVTVRPSTPEACRYYCGARADFAGPYVTPPATCTRGGRQAQRDRSLALYRSHRYAQAADTLQTLIAQCSQFMNRIETDQLRNDLALSQYRNHQASQCLETLNATLAAEFKNEEELKAGGPHLYLPPCDFDNYVGVAKATWFNKALCMKAKR